MKAIGKNSISSILKFVLSGFFGLQLIALVILTLVSLISLTGKISSPDVGLDVSFVDNHAPYEIKQGLILAEIRCVYLYGAVFASALPIWKLLFIG